MLGRPPPLTDPRTNRGRHEVRLDAGPRIDQDLLHNAAQQALELLGSAVGDRPLEPLPNPGYEVIGRDHWDRLAFGFQGRCAGLQRSRFSVEVCEALATCGLGQSSGLEGP
jgi:hypothetical protein